MVKELNIYYVSLIFLVSIHRAFTLKGKKGISITGAFQELVDETSLKPNKICVDKGRERYNRSMKSWLQDYSTRERKPFVSEKFIITLKNKIYK